jgi:hypothetical protein
VEKIVFQNGKVVSSNYLNEVQKGTSFTGTSRDEYYAEPVPGEQSAWNIGQRDSIKDWELADPRVDQETGVGRLAHDGIVLGWDGSEVVPGPPATLSVSGGIGVTVEAGSFVSRSGTPISWPRQQVQILGGVSSTSYIYIKESVALENIAAEESVTLSMSGSLPSVTDPHVPLAKLLLNTTGDGLATDPDTGEVVGTGYVDLRPNTFVGALNPYPQNLTNTLIKSEDYTAKAWERVIADTSNGSIIVTLPESPSDSDRIAVVDISGSFDRFPIIIRTNPETEELLNNSSDDWIVNIRDAHLELFYNEETGQWKFEEAPGSECNPVLGAFLSCGGREYIGDRTAAECPDGARLPTVYPVLSAGQYSFEPSQADPTLGKCYREYDETVALFANGTGGLVNVPQAPRCNRQNSSFTALSRNTIYVDQSIGEDSIDNRGFDKDRPFRTIERALLEGVRESRRAGQSNDRYDKVMLEIAPGDYYVDNTPGVLSGLSVTSETGLIQRVDTGFTISSAVAGDKTVTITVNVGDAISTQPPLQLNLGRVLYSESGGVGNIARVEKQSGSSANWNISLEYVRGTFEVDDILYYDNLSAVNPQTGGLIVPRGISVDGVDLRKVRIRPMYVPELSPTQDDPQTERTAIFKVTGGTYISLMTFTDNLQYARTHNTVTCVAFASEQEIKGGGSETSYYSRINSLFKDVDQWGDELLEAIEAETSIVARVPENKANRSRDIEENQTGLEAGDGRVNAPIAYPGATRIRDIDGAVVPLPDINSTRSSSPYVFNCSVRSIFGLNGLWADGSRVSGFRSMVTANFTQVSLQTDPNCFLPTTYFQDPPTSREDSEGKKYRESANDLFKYRHFGIRGSNDATIQIVSVFCIGNSDHFVSESGADLSITNSCSDFGDISLRGIGYKSKSFSQDEAGSAPGYNGTQITQIIPPLPLQYTPLADGRPATLEDIEVTTGLVIDYNKTLAYIRANKTPQNTPPSTIRVYVQNSNVASPFSLERPPSANDIAFGQYSYTRKVGVSSWELSGGPSRPNRKRIYINGFDELGNSILYTGNLQLAPTNSPGFTNLDDQSKVFAWDANPSDIGNDDELVPGSPSWYINVETGGITEETSDTDGDGYLLKRFDYAFRFKLLEDPTGQDAVFADLDFMFNRSAIKIIRAIDQRRADDRVYRVVLDGFDRMLGMRRPQAYYVLEKQSGVAGFPLNDSSALRDDPLTVTQVRRYSDVFGQTEGAQGRFVTYLTQGSRARDVFTGDFYPAQDSDYPELTEDPSTSVTKQALTLMEARASVNFSAALAPSTTPITVRTSSSAPAGIRIGLRRPSIIRASGHTWEWTGYLNYDTSFPTFQGEPLEQDFVLGKIITEENGGRVYATGMNEEGNYYLGTTVFDLRSGEQFSIPYASDSDADVTNLVLNNVVIKNSLLMQEQSNLIMSRGTTLFFSNDTELKSLTTGNITASRNPPKVYATTESAGIVELASPEDIRGARNPASLGISDKVVVTAFDLANELDARLSNSVVGGTGISVSQVTVELPGGDVNDPGDDITQFSVSAGLPGSEDPVAFAGLKLGSEEGNLVNNIVKTIGSSGSDSNLPTEKAVRNAINSASIVRDGDGINVLNNNEVSVDETVVRTLQGGATLVVLHVCPSGATPLEGVDSVPAGYPTANHGYLPGGTGLRKELFRTVTEALVKASSIFVPIGAEIIISVHAPLSAIEAGPLMLSNSTAPFVIAGARGATSPKINLSRVGTANCSVRLPEYTGFFFSAGAIFQDINVDVDCENQGGSEVGFLTFNGGFGVSARNLNITWKNVPSGGGINNATAPYGGKVVFRMSSDLVEENRAIYTNIEMSSDSDTCTLNMIGQSGGLLGHGINIVFDFKQSTYGASLNGTLVWRFNHNSLNEDGVKLRFLGCGGRGGCNIGSRVGPQVLWNFSDVDWDMSEMFSPFSGSKNYCGLSFKTKSVNGLNPESAATIAPVTLRRGATVDGSGPGQSGPFSLYLALQGTGSLPAALVVPTPGEGSYLY